MYKIRINNDRNIFEISALLSSRPMRKSRAGKFKIIYIFLIFPLYIALDFLVRKIKEREFQILSVDLYPIFYIIPWSNLDLLSSDLKGILAHENGWMLD